MSTRGEVVIIYDSNQSKPSPRQCVKVTGAVNDWGHRIAGESRMGSWCPMGAQCQCVCVTGGRRVSWGSRVRVKEFRGLSVFVPGLANICH